MLQSLPLLSLLSHRTVLTPIFLKHCWYHLVKMDTLHWATRVAMIVAEADALASIYHVMYTSRKAKMSRTGEQTRRCAMRRIVAQKAGRRQSRR